MKPIKRTVQPLYFHICSYVSVCSILFFIFLYYSFDFLYFFFVSRYFPTCSFCISICFYTVYILFFICFYNFYSVHNFYMFLYCSICFIRVLLLYIYICVYIYIYSIQFHNPTISHVLYVLYVSFSICSFPLFYNFYVFIYFPCLIIVAYIFSCCSVLFYFLYFVI